ncbi:MAG TPA: SatD family protein [bacterium]|nr:SatD family protein [bacterium]
MRRTKPKLYLAVIGDLAGSREVSNRGALQRELKQALKRIADRKSFAPVRAAGPEITAGDEFQVLLHTGEKLAPGTPAMAYLVELTEDLPVQCLFGIGLGTISTPLKTPIGELDGPCFHRAREAVEQAKREGRWAVVAGMPAEEAAIANAILRIAGSIRESWTERQKEIIRVRRKTPLQKDVARKLKVSPSVISEALSAARHDAILETDAAVAAILDRVAKSDKAAIQGEEKKESSS